MFPARDMMRRVHTNCNEGKLMSVVKLFQMCAISRSPRGAVATYLCDSKAEVDHLGCHCEGDVVLVINM
jgi:hypothetical protein